ncbi:MAG TPA: sigma-70 family RNA polymerase sigma factor [Gemmataceae bacterium]|jgi:RNA polymerase sigma-70 factor (ECF subfamily)
MTQPGEQLPRLPEPNEKVIAEPQSSGEAGAAGKMLPNVSASQADPDNSEAAQFADLIRRIRAGQEEAAAELVRRYEPAIRRVVRVHLRDSRLRRILDSMDVCQSVLATFFVRANLGQYELDTPESLLKLLATIARNKLSNQANRQRAARRDHRREQSLSDRDASLKDPRSDPAQQSAARELLEKVRERLSEEERRLAEQRVRGDSWAEIAATNAGTPEGLRKRLTRAIERALRQLGLGEGGDE